MNQIEKYPDNTSFTDLYSKLIDKKTDFDIQKLEKQKEILINHANNYFKYCMQDLQFKFQWQQVANNFQLNDKSEAD
jgi:hypothetical protein